MPRLLIGIDIGGTKCAVILGTNAPQIIDRKVFATRTDRGPQQTIQNIFKKIEKLLRTNQIDLQQIAGIGISCGGPLDSNQGIILAPPNLPGWKNIPLVKLIEDQYSIKTGIQNDANACALAEWQWGAGKGCRNLIFLTFGTGMGAGLILDGKLYTGTNDNAGEIGHIRLAKTGPSGYHKTGSFEGFCSGGGIAQLAQKILLKKYQAGKPASFGPNPEVIKGITTEEIAQAAKNGDPVAEEILQISGRYLGLGLAILIDILNPEKIIIGSIFARCQKFFWPAAEKIIRKEALPLAAGVCQIVPAALGEQIGDYASLGVALNLLEMQE